MFTRLASNGHVGFYLCIKSVDLNCESYSGKRKSKFSLKRHPKPITGTKFIPGFPSNDPGWKLKRTSSKCCDKRAGVRVAGGVEIPNRKPRQQQNRRITTWVEKKKKASKVGRGSYRNLKSREGSIPQLSKEDSQVARTVSKEKRKWVIQRHV